MTPNTEHVLYRAFLCALKDPVSEGLKIFRLNNLVDYLIYDDHDYWIRIDPSNCQLRKNFHCLFCFL